MDVRRALKAPARRVQAGDLIPDGRLAADDVDRLDNAAIAQTVADVALTASPPTNIALFGPWGSGKSSIFSMLEVRVHELDKRVRVVRYDAWKYGGRDLKRNFISSVAADLDPKNKATAASLVADTKDSRLDLKGWLKNNIGSLILGLVVAVALAAIWVAVLAGAQVALNDADFWVAAGRLVAPSGTVFGLALAALIVGPKALEGAVVTTATPAPSGDDEFSDRFRQLLTSTGVGPGNRLIVFVDELDRCSPDDVVATLVDLKTFLEVPNCVFVVAVDRAVVEDALSKVPQAKPVQGDEPYYATRGAFLDKIFQHQIALPPLRARTLTLFARELVDGQTGLWRELREADRSLYELVVFALVPVHIRSPRRVKVLLNAYATNVRIAQARDVDWLKRATEIAALTVLQTEFPEVAADLLRVPRLLEFLRGTEPQGGPEVQRIVDRYRPLREAEPTAGVPEIEDDDVVAPAGELLTDGTDEDQLPVATWTLYNQLFAYLTKIAHAGIPDPRPDLLYLQSAGHRDGLDDPALSDVIDFATDTAPDRVVAAFSSQPLSVLRAAVPLLVVEGEQTLGPGRFFAYDSACRLVEALDWEDVRAIARDLAPRVLPSCEDARWPSQAIPGALRLAAAAGHMQAATSLARRLDGNADDSLLLRVALSIPVLDAGTVNHICSVIADAYGERPQPLHAALGQLPLVDALALWDEAGDRALAILKQLESSAAAIDAAPNRSGRTRGSSAGAPEPTGRGRTRLRELLEAALARDDGEVLLSAVFGRAQSTGDESLRAELTAAAPEVLGGMSDAARVAQHVLTGIDNASPSEWPLWTKLLRETPPESSLVSSASLVLTGVIDAIPDTEVEDLRHVAPTIRALRSLMAGHVPDERLLARFGPILTAFQWAGDDVDEDEWEARRRAALEAADLLREAVGGAEVDRLLAADVFGPVTEYALTLDTVDVLLDRIDRLPDSAASILSKDLDGWRPPEDEQLARTRLQLRSRVVARGRPLEVAELSVLDDNAGSTEAFSDWLTLGPSGHDVAALLPKVSPTAASLERWARAATEDDRTAVWIALEKTRAVNAILAAVGRHGVTGAVVEHLEHAVRSGQRQQIRDEAITRLETARLGNGSGSRSSDARRAASELAEYLLQSGIGGDARLARRVVAWAGQPAHGYRTRLRVLFDGAAKQKNTFGKSELEELRGLGLLSKRRRGLAKGGHGA